MYFNPSDDPGKGSCPEDRCVVIWWCRAETTEDTQELSLCQKRQGRNYNLHRHKCSHSKVFLKPRCQVERESNDTISVSLICHLMFALLSMCYHEHWNQPIMFPNPGVQLLGKRSHPKEHCSVSFRQGSSR